MRSASAAARTLTSAASFSSSGSTLWAMFNRDRDNPPLVAPIGLSENASGAVTGTMDLREEARGTGGQPQGIDMSTGSPSERGLGPPAPVSEEPVEGFATKMAPGWANRHGRLYDPAHFESRIARALFGARDDRLPDPECGRRRPELLPELRCRGHEAVSVLPRFRGGG